MEFAGNAHWDTDMMRLLGNVCGDVVTTRFSLVTINRVFVSRAMSRLMGCVEHVDLVEYITTSPIGVSMLSSALLTKLRSMAIVYVLLVHIK